MNSMTGYGRGESKDDSRSIGVEIKTVNHRYNDISIRMPKNINYLEDTIRKEIKSYINRGKVEVYIKMEYVSGDDTIIVPNIELARSYKEAIEAIAKSTGVEGECNLSELVKFPEVLKAQKPEEDEEHLKGILMDALTKAVENLLEMRSQEGQKLLKDIDLKLSNIEDLLGQIEERAPEIVENYRERLNSRVEELLDGKYDLDESRLANEVAYFADKAGIDEEIVRLRSHISQVRETSRSEDVIGRKLDFIVQEMNRETNTIGSKVGDVEITNCVVDVKTEIEKIREQIQNIE